ncbi:MAG: hypothetical protein ACOC5C_00530 [Halobacteriota archaeon]
MPKLSLFKGWIKYGSLVNIKIVSSVYFKNYIEKLISKLLALIIMPELEDKILKVIKSNNVPLVTSEIADKLDVDRRIVLRRLQRLAIEGKVKGRRIEAANGIWIWWL